MPTVNIMIQLLIMLWRLWIWYLTWTIMCGTLIYLIAHPWRRQSHNWITRGSNTARGETLLRVFSYVHAFSLLRSGAKTAAKSHHHVVRRQLHYTSTTLLKIGSRLDSERMENTTPHFRVSSSCLLPSLPFSFLLFRRALGLVTPTKCTELSNTSNILLLMQLKCRWAPGRDHSWACCLSLLPGALFGRVRKFGTIQYPVNWSQNTLLLDFTSANTDK